jgi:hypothetical protein
MKLLIKPHQKVKVKENGELQCPMDRIFQVAFEKFSLPIPPMSSQSSQETNV